MHSKKWWSAASADCIVPRSGALVPLLGIGFAAVLLAIAACGFPRPEEIHDDAGAAGYARDQDCGVNTPYCISAACVACNASASCPAARPVCDLTSHDCRSCVQDVECDSGACDLAAGTCVAQGSILYASPGGNAADPCTRANPCSFSQASSAVDSTHPYIVLLPGAHTTIGSFDGRNVTVCATGAIINPDAARIIIAHGASVAIRGLKMVQASAVAITGAGNAIELSGSLTLDNVEFQLTDRNAILGGPSITIRNSIISGGFIQAEGNLLIDRSTFLPGGGIANFSPVQAAEITNSVFISTPGQDTIRINESGDTTSPGYATVANNTFINSTIVCNGSELYEKSFESNIFYRPVNFKSIPGCRYNYNLITPVASVVGTGNITGDPLFVDIASSNFHLKAGSPAIDAASTSPSAPNGHDHDGTPRPQGAGVDIGAFEYVP